MLFFYPLLIIRCKLCIDNIQVIRDRLKLGYIHLSVFFVFVFGFRFVHMFTGRSLVEVVGVTCYHNDAKHGFMSDLNVEHFENAYRKCKASVSSAAFT